MTAAITTLVRVTAEHIATGKQVDPHCCALALAINQALSAAAPDFRRCRVVDIADAGESERLVAIVRQGAMVIDRRSLTADLDEKTVEWIHQFDAGGKVAPFEFKLTWEEA